MEKRRAVLPSKVLLFRWIVALVVLVVLSTASTPSPTAVSLRVGIYTNMPLSGVDEEGKPEGIFVDILQEIAAQENWALDWYPCAFQTCLDLLDTGEIDLLGAVAYSPERAEYLDFSQETVLTNWGRIYTRPDAAIRSLLDLDGTRLALLTGDVHAQAFRDIAQSFGIQPRYVWLDTYDAVFEAVRNGEAEAGIVNRIYGESHHRAYDLRPTAIIFNPLDIHYTAPKGRQPVILETIDRHLRAMKDAPNSVYYHSLEHWFGGQQKAAPPIPSWLIWGLGLSIFGVLVFFSVALMLRQRVQGTIAELDLQNKRLTAEIERHKATQETLQLHTAALETTATAVMIADTGGTLVWVNPAYTRLTGYTDQESIGRKTYSLFSACLPQPVPDALLRALRNGESWRGEVTSARKDGQQYIAELVVVPITGLDGKVQHYVATLQDITERKMQMHIREMRLKISRALEGLDTSKSLGERIVALAQEVFQAKTVALSLYAKAGGETVLCASGMWKQYVDGTPPSAWPRPGDDETALFSVRAETNTTGVPFLSVLRLATPQERVGHLWVGHNIPLSPADDKVLAEIPSTLAFALQRANLMESLRVSLQRINALNTVALAIASSVDVNITANILLDEMVAQTNIQGAALSVYRPEGHTVEIIQTRNLPTGVLPRSRNALSNPYLSTAIGGQRPVIVSDLRESTRPGDATFRTLIRHFRGYGCFPLIAKGKINGLLEIYSQSPLPPEGAWLDFTHLLSRQAAIGIENATLFHALQRSKDELTVSFESALLGWSRAMAIRHHEPLEHAERTAELCVRVAQRMGLQEESTLRAARYGAWLHDIGKLSIAEDVLYKDRPFDEDDWARSHTMFSNAEALMESVPLLESASIIPRYRYERWDGSGYPDGLQGDSIPLLARIFSVVHFWDARSEQRHYMPAMSREERLACLQEQAGKRFDPAVVEAFIEVISGML